MALENGPPGMLAFMRSGQNLSKAIQRERSNAKGYPKKPKSFDDVATIPDHLSATGDGQPFVLLNDTVIPDDPSPNAKRLLVFMSQTGKEVLASCTSWYVDGTFKPANETLFAQIVFVVGLTAMGKAVPCVFSLLPNKEKATYLRLAEKVKEEMGNDLKVGTIMMDYEKGLNNAFNITFENVNVVGCDFHWKNCLLKRLSDDGLLELYNRDMEFHLLIRYIWALSYVPLVRVVDFWEKFIGERVRAGCKSWEEFNTGIASFIKYVDSNWIGELHTTTKIRKKPGFPHIMWNKFQEFTNNCQVALSF
jgi:hypothetical protein